MCQICARLPTASGHAGHLAGHLRRRTRGRAPRAADAIQYRDVPSACGAPRRSRATQGAYDTTRACHHR
jgi:hypothetical protein